MSEDIMNPFVPVDGEQEKLAKFEDLTPAAKIEQLNSVKDKFIADNVTKRPVSMFAQDIEANKDTLSKEIKDKKTNERKFGAI